MINEEKLKQMVIDLKLGESSESFEEMLKEANATYHIIGDAQKPGNIKDAISTAFELTKNL